MKPFDGAALAASVGTSVRAYTAEAFKEVAKNIVAIEVRVRMLEDVVRIQRERIETLEAERGNAGS